MKVTISAKGEMLISGEDELESYALNKWWEDWQAHKATLGVMFAHPTTPGAVTIGNVEEKT